MITCLNALKAAFSKKVPSNEALHPSFTNALAAWSLILTVAEDSIACEQIQK